MSPSTSVKQRISLSWLGRREPQNCWHSSLEFGKKVTAGVGLTAELD